MIFIDRLSFRTIFISLKYGLRNRKKGRNISIHVLDPITKGPITKLLVYGMKLFDITFIEADFFAGHLTTKNGENVWTASHRYLKKIAFDAAKKNIEQSDILNSLNLTWGNNSIMLCLAKFFYSENGYGGNHTALKILVSDALARESEDDSYLILSMPPGLQISFFPKEYSDINIIPYSYRKMSMRNTRFSTLLLIIFYITKGFITKISSMLQHRVSLGNNSIPALLVLQEDELSMDRSYRHQPHWIHKEDIKPAFRTIVKETNSQIFSESSWAELSEYNIYGLFNNDIYQYTQKYEIHKKIKQAKKSLLLLSIFGTHYTVETAFKLTHLFIRAYFLASLCKAENVKAFMTCENYMADANAMNLIAPQLGLKTFSYQYSNMTEIGPIMMTTASTIFSYSPLFHSRWTNEHIKPKFIDIGYHFDSSFKLVKHRAQEFRKKIKNNNNFIITYFDESIQHDKYGLTSNDENQITINRLAQLVCDDPSIVVIIKTQFNRNFDNAVNNGNEVLKSALSSGRLIKMRKGTHRNSIFPSEAALASDIVIGNAVGGTAAVETAMVDKRCVLLNPYKLLGPHIEIYKKYNILYKDLESAINAIENYRSGKPSYADLGDWSHIKGIFDPFTDGNSSNRLRESIEEIML